MATTLVANYFLMAWTEPTLPPPGGGVAQIFFAGLQTKIYTDQTCVSIFADLDSITGNILGHSGNGIAMYANDGSWFMSAVSNGDCSPETNTTRGFAYIPRDSSGNPVQGFFKGTASY